MLTAFALLGATVSLLSSLPSPPSAGLRVFLVRHGQALSNLDPHPALSPAELDHLTRLGRRQAEHAGFALRDAAVVGIWSSPARRARETADRIRGVLGTGPVAEAPALRPRDSGPAPAPPAPSRAPTLAHRAQARDPAGPRGESGEQVAERVLGLARTALTTHRGGAVVLVTHEEVIAAVLRQAMPRRQGREPITLAPGSISVVDLSASGAPRLRRAGVSPPDPASTTPASSARIPPGPAPPSGPRSRSGSSPTPSAAPAPVPAPSPR